MPKADDSIRDDDDRARAASFAAQARTAIEFLESLAENRVQLLDLTKDDRSRLMKAAGEVYAPDVAKRRHLIQQKNREHRDRKRKSDDGVLTETGIRALRRKPVFITPNLPAPPADDVVEIENEPREVREPQNCYVCKRDYSQLHHFYDQLCPACAELNYRKRTETADLSGRVALLTGGRVKIGYQAGIKLLRAGAKLIVSTRFPRDAAARYAREPDFAAWKDRLEIYGIDLRHTPSVEAFCQHIIHTQTRLDFIISNACQTVRRPPDFYRHMMAGEKSALDEHPPEVRKILGAYEGLRGYNLLPEGTAPLLAKGAAPAGIAHAAELSQAALLAEDINDQNHLFPEGRLDQDLQQVDLRERNSWRLMLAEVPTVELLETQLINAVAPFVLNARLKPLMMSTPERDKHIVNVSAVEGQFYRKFKTTRHPHTNMAKAALNMMTRTSAAEYHGDGIHMNSVDTGWVTDEDPAHVAERKQADHRFHPPLDIVDGAARIVDPIIDGFNTGVHVWGKFLKDYKEVPW